MTQTPLYDQALTNILRIVVNSSWPFHERELGRSAKQFYSDGSSIIALHNTAIPRLQQIFNQVNNPDGLFADLRNILDAGVSSWFTTPVHGRLISDIDFILDQMYETLKSIENEIKRLQRKFCYADFISDLFSVITRDIAGGALELQHYIPNPHQGHNAPPRDYFHFRHALAYQTTIIGAAKKVFQGQTLVANDYLDIIGAIGRVPGDNTRINDWLNHLRPIYERVAQKYHFNNMDEMFDYILIKEARNINSHFKNWIIDFNENGQTTLEEFLDQNIFLRAEFDGNERNLLEFTYGKCSAALQARPKLYTGSTITVTPINNPQRAYNAYFMQEMDPVHEYRIARCIVTENSNRRRVREAEYWHPEQIDSRQVTIKSGHRIPEPTS